MKKRDILWLAAIFVALIFPLQVSVANQNSSVDCSNALATADLQYCAAQLYRYADEDLNHTWKTFTENLEPNFKRSLIQAQQDWIKFRDSHCDATTFRSRGGTAYMIFYDECLEKMTRQRTEQLRNILEPNYNGGI
ncbi:MAG: DUF1311 domain-containing protein [Magnetococcales bacterium]|nr:DUF1311 domain-containing protein [Magnetococcales bacterium]